MMTTGILTTTKPDRGSWISDRCRNVGCFEAFQRMDIMWLVMVRMRVVVDAVPSTEYVLLVSALLSSLTNVINA